MNEPRAFRTAEDELDFILGTDAAEDDGGGLFELEDLNDDGPVGAPFGHSFAATPGPGKPSPPPSHAPSFDFALERKVTMSPTTDLDVRALRHELLGREPLAFHDAPLPGPSAPLAAFDDFPLDLAGDDLYAESVLPGYLEGAVPAPAPSMAAWPVGGPGFVPSLPVPVLPPPSHGQPVPIIHHPITPGKKKGQSPHRLRSSHRPLRKRKVAEKAPVVAPETEPKPKTHDASAEGATAVDPATKAREARKRRRLRLIERAAVADARNALADLAFAGEFARTFRADAFVEVTFDGAFAMLLAASKQIADGLQLGQAYAPSLTPLQLPSPTTAAKSTQAPVVVTPKAAAKPKPVPGGVHDKLLPSGKDPESRRLRRLMRNRLSAQASRDRRRRDLEDVRRQKAAKEGEMSELKVAVAKEAQRLAQLERAVAMARRKLGAEGTKLEGPDANGSSAISVSQA